MSAHGTTFGWESRTLMNTWSQPLARVLALIFMTAYSFVTYKSWICDWKCCRLWLFVVKMCTLMHSQAKTKQKENVRERERESIQTYLSSIQHKSWPSSLVIIPYPIKSMFANTNINQIVFSFACSFLQIWTRLILMPWVAWSSIVLPI